MPTKEYFKEYYQKHKEYYKEYREKNKEHRKEYKKKWHKNNKEHSKEYAKEYRQTDVGKKSFIIGNWKHRGLIHDDYEALYDKYINTFECDNCGVELVSGLYGNNKR